MNEGKRMRVWGWCLGGVTQLVGGDRRAFYFYRELSFYAPIKRVTFLRCHRKCVPG